MSELRVVAMAEADPGQVNGSFRRVRSPRATAPSSGRTSSTRPPSRVGRAATAVGAGWPSPPYSLFVVGQGRAGPGPKIQTFEYRNHSTTGRIQMRMVMLLPRKVLTWQHTAI